MTLHVVVFNPVLSHIILLNKSQLSHLFGLWTGGMLRENSEYLTRVWDLHLSHQQETCIERIQVPSLPYVEKT